MKNQALFSLKDKSKQLKFRLLQFLFGVLRIKHDIFATFEPINVESICTVKPLNRRYTYMFM